MKKWNQCMEEASHFVSRLCIEYVFIFVSQLCTKHALYFLLQLILETKVEEYNKRWRTSTSKDLMFNMNEMVTMGFIPP